MSEIFLKFFENLQKKIVTTGKYHSEEEPSSFRTPAQSISAHERLPVWDGNDFILFNKKKIILIFKCK